MPNQMDVDIDTDLRAAVLRNEAAKKLAAENAQLAPRHAEVLKSYFAQWAAAVNERGVLKPARFVTPRLSVKSIFNRFSHGDPAQYQITLAFGSIAPEGFASALITDRIEVGEIVPSGSYGHKLEGKTFSLKQIDQAQEHLRQSAMGWLVKNGKINPGIIDQILKPEL